MVRLYASYRAELTPPTRHSAIAQDCLPDTWRTTNDDLPERSTAVLIVLLGWGYVVVLMALAEATGANGSILGALVTLLLYGVLPLSVVLYIGGTRARWRARVRARDAAAPAPAASGDVDPAGGGEPAGGAVAPVREEP